MILMSKLFALLPFLLAGGLFALWTSHAWRVLVRYPGKIKRGFPIWREPLSEDMYLFFSHLSADIVTKRGFIKTNGQIVLVGGTSAHFRKNSWPYVAIIDLARQPTQIEYRTSLPALLFTLPLLVLLSPLIIMYVNHVNQTKSIMDFIHEQMQRNSSEIMLAKQFFPVPNESKQANPVTITPRGKQILFVVMIAFTINFMIFFGTSLLLGGTATSGYIENGHYYLSNHAVDTEVSEMVWKLSYMHTIATYLTFPLNFLVLLLLFVRGEIAFKLTA